MNPGRSARRWFVLAGLVLCLWPSAAMAQRTAVLLARAQRFVDRGEPQRAVPLIERAIALDPSDPTAVRRLAALVLPIPGSAAATQPNAQTQQRAAQILAAIEQVAMRDDSGVGGRAQSLFAEQVRATLYARSLADAVALWEGRDALLSAELAAIGRELAQVAIGRGELALAQGIVARCARLDAQDVSLRSDLGAIALARGRAHEALVIFRELAVARPADLTAQRDYAGAMLAVGDTIGAVSVLEGVGSCRDDCNCALELTRAAVEAERASVATEAAGAALRVCSQQDAEPALWLASAELLAQRRSQARTAYRLALQRDPASARAREGLASLDAQAQ